MKADYRCMVGVRKVNKFISNADLGITGVFYPVTYTVTWDAGEAVDPDRARKLCGVLKAGLNEAEDLECKSVELTNLYHEL